MTVEFGVFKPDYVLTKLNVIDYKFYITYISYIFWWRKILYQVFHRKQPPKDVHAWSEENPFIVERCPGFVTFRYPSRLLPICLSGSIECGIKGGKTQ